MSLEPFDPNRAVGAAGRKPGKGSESKAMSVWQVTRLVKQAIEDTLPATIHVVGQLSNFKRHSSGHLYFTLKDDRSELSCVMWRSSAAKLKFDPTDGMDILAVGQIDVFERSGRYQLYARSIEPRGIGALELAFRQLCEKLDAEGLFDSEHKKPLPRYPQQIAVVTSPTGAAIQDIVDTLRRRYPCAAILVHPVRVQGPGSAEEVAKAIGSINRRSESLGGVDLMIVGRGGGSIEDLWAFNEEVVARAIYASDIPVISAVGHETDITVADLVADVRAATPTAAAELAVPQLEEVLEELSYREAALNRQVRHKLELCKAGLTAAIRRRPFADPGSLVIDKRRVVEELQASINRAMVNKCQTLHRRLGQLELALQRVAPQRYVEVQKRRLFDVWHRVILALSHRESAGQRALTRSAERLAKDSPRQLIDRQVDRLGGLEKDLKIAMAHRLRSATAELRAGESRLVALSHQATLARGFTLTRSKRTGKLVRSVKDVREGDRLITDLHDGSLESRILDSQQPELFD